MKNNNDKVWTDTCWIIDAITISSLQNKKEKSLSLSLAFKYYCVLQLFTSICTDTDTIIVNTNISNISNIPIEEDSLSFIYLALH